MRPRLLEPAAVVAGFAVLTAIVLYPLPFHLSTLVYASEQGDGQFSVWNVAWVARALLFHPTGVFDANIFYPHRGTLAYSEMNLAAGAIAAPIYLLTRNAYAAHNFALLSSFVLSGTGMYFLCREIARDRRAATVGAVTFAFCPHLFGHLPHIQLLMTAGLPFSMLAFHRVLDRPSPGRGAWLGLAMSGQAYACGYYAVFVLLMVGFATLLMPALDAQWRRVAYWKAIGTGALTALITSLPLILAALFLQESGFNRSLDGSRQYVADWRAYLASGNRLHAWMLPYLGHWKEVLFPGVIALLFGIAGLIIGWRAGGRRRQMAMLYGTLATAAAWASFGPQAFLYTILYKLIPTFSLLRAPSRFGLVVVFSLSVLASLSVAALLARSRWASLVAALLIAGAMAEAMVPIRFDPALQPGPAYRLLATLPDGPLLELPVYSRVLGFRRARYMLDSTTHWKPLLDAYSDYIPPDFDARAEVIGDFPTREAFADLAKDHVRYVIIHLEPYSPAMRADLERRLAEFASALRLLYSEPQLRMYEIVGQPN
jgi:hypothetical protein